MLRASHLHEVEANLYLAQTYDRGVDGSLSVTIDWSTSIMKFDFLVF